MKKFFLCVSLTIMMLICASCSSDKPNGKAKTNSETNIASEDKKEASSSTEKNETSEESLNDEANDDSLVKDTVWQVEMTDNDKEWIEKNIKLLCSKDIDKIKSSIAGSAKTAVDKDPNLIIEALKPLEISGDIVKIEKVSMESGQDGDGSKAYIYQALCQGEKKKIYFNLARNIANQLISFQLSTADFEENQDELKEKYKAFINKSLEVIGTVKSKDYETFKAYFGNVGAKEEDIKNLYDMILNDIDSLNSNYSEPQINIAEKEAKNVFADKSMQGKAIEILIKYLGDATKPILYYDFFYDEDMNIYNLTYRR